MLNDLDSCKGILQLSCKNLGKYQINQENALSIHNEEVNMVRREIASEMEKFHEEKKYMLTEHRAPLRDQLS